MNKIVSTGWLTTVVLLLCLTVNTVSLSAQNIDLNNRPVAKIELVGVKPESEQLVRNQIRLAEGQPYSADIVSQDIVRITHLGRFATVQATVDQQEDGTLVVKYVVNEQTILADVRVVGNKAISDQELLALAVIRSGDPIDSYLIDRAINQIKRAYEDKGYFMTEIVLDQQLLNESSVLLFKIREGPKIRVREIKFSGNTVYSDKELKTQVKSKTYMFILREGELNRTALNEDADRIREYYRDRGYLDAQADRELDISANQKDAVVTFNVTEGKRYTVSQITVNGNELYGQEQILGTMTLKVGDIFASNLVRKSRENLLDLYGKQGYIETNVQVERLFHDDSPQVDVTINITEGNPYVVGKVAVRGNEITRDNVILRQTRGMNPGRRFDRTGLERTQRRLRDGALFSDAKISILGEPEDEVRDVLIEVKEKNTGSISFGAGISSDAGIIGAIDLKQRNFDITDVPESFGEFVTGKAFRGAGQSFGITLQPGDETSNYSINFAEPYLFDTQYSFDTSAFFYNRERDDYDEGRQGGTFGFGQRFGDVWSGRLGFRAEQVDISDVESDAPTDISDVEGTSLITSIGGTLSRSTVDSRLNPSKGSVASVGLWQIGAMGGDYEFTKLTFEFSKFWTVDEDFMGRKTTLAFKSKIGYILQDNEAPIFERFFAGGHRSFRGFKYRGVGPYGTKTGGGDTDDSIGGDWMFLVGLEYSIPVYQESVRWVFFTDTGTVQDDFGFDEYRVSIGTGLRLQVPFLGQAPFAFDFAIPVIKQDKDDEEIFSFDIALPF
ncbi:MAG: outer membrane protein assembly factor BamA [Phycisphaeraceae bacterium JB051]